ncbi:MAG: DUF2764 domain-containing protein [Bacteroidales bacterium]|jgi:hypothetical protein|nr:DUF2764 domain-containing protein [Bacteroidales bacterium]MCI1785766.1 DUF2764 domain-containing protein [Bacteroidales bacterium]
MDNYYYLISGLPELSKEWKFADNSSAGKLLEEIRENCSDRDNVVIDLMLNGFDDKKLNYEFYRVALDNKNRFIREYFKFDLNMRNAKVGYLNEALGRDSKKDTITVPVEDDEFEEASKIDSALHTGDILGRERALDAILWDKIDELTTFDYFDLDALLGFIAKLHIIDRWFRLDESEGRKMFKKLVDQVRGTFKGVGPEVDKLNN